MNKISKVVKQKQLTKKNKPVVNFMGGISYEINPLETLKMVSASSIFAEPQYYNDKGMKDGSAYKSYNDVEKEHIIFDFDTQSSTSEIMIDVIKNALDYDFEGTINWARTLRKDYFMRLNPQVIMVLAAMHPKRLEFNKQNPGVFRQINKEVMSRADEPASQLSFYLYYYGSKSKIPSILKRSWCDKLESLSAYEMSKYKNSHIGMIDLTRICHANNSLINELMTTRNIQVAETDKTWENLRSSGMEFKEIIKTIKIPHMALLRNLKNIFFSFSNEDRELAKDTLEYLKSGVKNGKQFPFRYYSALKVIQSNKNIPFYALIVQTLEECIDLSVENMPKLKGKTICLSDNSGSAWGTFESEYGSVTVAEIDNLSSVITSINSDEGYVGKFGDNLNITAVIRKNGILSQAREISNDKGDSVGLSTENGIWLFFRDAITNKTHYDNIFIYSDMQAGHGGLYGKGNAYVIEGKDFILNGRYIDVLSLIKEYRNKVNPKVNVFCVQTAGYKNVLIPEYIYRGAILYGWTGKESIFANELIRQWDELENKQ